MGVVISGEIDFAPEARERVLVSAKELIAAALREKGCVHYAWTADLLKPGRVHVFEEWDTEADLAAHLAGPAYEGMRDHLGAAGILNAETRKYRFDIREPVYDAGGRARADFFTAKK